MGASSGITVILLYIYIQETALKYYLCIVGLVPPETS